MSDVGLKLLASTSGIVAMLSLAALLTPCWIMGSNKQDGKKIYRYEGLIFFVECKEDGGCEVKPLTVELSKENKQTKRYHLYGFITSLLIQILWITFPVIALVLQILSLKAPQKRNLYIPLSAFCFSIIVMPQWIKIGNEVNLYLNGGSDTDKSAKFDIPWSVILQAVAAGLSTLSAIIQIAFFVRTERKGNKDSSSAANIKALNNI
ncbi:hypothetical protein CHS0354_037775 [Potamilus streckersoni]|uniref:Uncharacterized protein n=1 Tax=Potamilus streckersoni TaxID=2493646 RepID=A0AAE0T3B1_9BIVA|nr:hypothetical protein CHS0354_037775 [Potamilus streckersoni]